MMKFKAKIRKQGSDRKVIEVPKSIRDQVKSGVECEVEVEK